MLETPQPLNRRQVIINSLIALALSGVSFYLFTDSGLLNKYYHINLSFLLPPLIVLIVFIFASSLFKLLADNSGAKLIALTIKYLGISVAVYFILDRALLFSRLGIFAKHLDVLQTISTLALIGVLFIIGLGFSRHAEWFDYRYKKTSLVPIIQSFAFILIGATLWQGLSQFAVYWSGFNTLAWIIISGFWAVSLTYLLRYATSSESILVADITKWLTRSPVAIFFIGICTATYFAVIRGLIYSLFAYAFYFEWVLILFIAWNIFQNIRNSLKKSHTNLILEADWRKHVQLVNQLDDDDFNKMLDLQSEFIDKGSRQYLLNYLMLMLNKNGYKGESMTPLLSSVIEYNDKKIPWYALGFWKKRIQQNNRAKRQRALDNLLDGIKSSVLVQHKPV